jgi:hypothetical protein
MPETTDEIGTRRKLATACVLFLLIPVAVIAKILWHMYWL